MTLRSILFNFTINTFYLLKTPLKFGLKIKIWLNYLKYTVIYARRSKGKKIRARFLGLEFEAFDGPTFYYLFTEVFVKNEYYFEAKTDSPVIFDAGANVGMATLYFKFLYPKATIVSFEPDPETFQQLNRNILINNFQDVTTHNLALSTTDGTTKFYISSDPGSLIMSLNRERTQDVEKDSAARTQEVEVVTARLSDYVDSQVDLLKIDVEGAEQSVFDELMASGKITQFKEIIMEYHHKIGSEKSKLSVMLALLEKAGFEYQMDVINMPINRKEVFQDIHLNAYQTKFL
jgi:FkbM family methyltransferase